MDYLNSINEHIKFTYETEQDSTIPYLDLIIKRQLNGQLRFSVFRKNTHTDQYLNADSYNPLAHKIATASTLFHRAESHCSEEFKEAEFEKVRESLITNGYNTNLINSCSQRVSATDLPEASDGIQQPVKYVSAPYIKGSSERVARLLKPFSIKLAHKPSNTIKSQLCHMKDKRQILEKNNVIYEIKCYNCEATYIGETGKELGKRITEHKNAVARRDPLSHIFRHIDRTGHIFDWDIPNILGQETNTHRRKLMESFFTQKNPHAINRAVTVPVPYVATVNDLIG